MKGDGIQQRKWGETAPQDALLRVAVMLCSLLIGSSQAHALDAAAYHPVLQSVVEMVASQETFQGFGVGVRFGTGQTWFGAGGYRDIARTEPFDVYDQFRIGSHSKTFTGTAVLQLVDQGKIGLADTLARWVPELNIPNSGAITVRNLLSMTSGIPDYLNALSLHIPTMTVLQEWSNFTSSGPYADANYTPQELVQAVIQTPGQRFMPIGEMNYSNTNFVILGIIAEKASCTTVAGCRSIETLVNDDIAARLHLDNTRFPTSKQFTRAYVENAQLVMQGSDFDVPDNTSYNVTFADPRVPWAAGAVISNNIDELAWIRQLANNADGLLTPQTHMARLVAPSGGSVAAIPARYGLAIYYMPSVGTGTELLGHSGMIGGYTTSIFHSPSLDVSFSINFSGAQANAAAWFPLYGAEAAFGSAIRSEGIFSSEPILWTLERNLRIAMEAQGSCSRIGPTDGEMAPAVPLTCNGDSVRTAPLVLNQSAVNIEASKRSIGNSVITSSTAFALVQVPRPSIAAFGSRMTALAMNGESALTLLPGSILEITGVDSVGIGLFGSSNRLLVQGEIRSYGARTVAIRSGEGVAGCGVGSGANTNEIVVDAGARIGGDVQVSGRSTDLRIDGTVVGNIVLAAGSVTRLSGRGTVTGAILGAGILTADSDLQELNLSSSLASPEVDKAMAVKLLSHEVSVLGVH